MTFRGMVDMVLRGVSIGAEQNNVIMVTGWCWCIAASVCFDGVGDETQPIHGCSAMNLRTTGFERLLSYPDFLFYFN